MSNIFQNLTPRFNSSAAPVALALSLASATITGCASTNTAQPPKFSPPESLPPDLAQFVVGSAAHLEGANPDPNRIPFASSNNLELLAVNLECDHDLCSVPLIQTADGMGIKVKIANLAGTTSTESVAVIDTGGLFQLSLTTSEIDPAQIFIPNGSTPLAIKTPLGPLGEYRGLIRSIEVPGEAGSFTLSPIQISYIPATRNDPLLLGLEALSVFDGVGFFWQESALRIFSQEQLNMLANDQSFRSYHWDLAVAKSSASAGRDDLRKGDIRVLKKLPTLAATVGSDQNAYTAVLDTGSSVPVIVHDKSLIAHPDGLAWATGHLAKRQPVSYGPTKHDIQVGPILLPAGTTAVFIPGDNVSYITLGLPALRGHNIVLDFTQRKVWFSTPLSTALSTAHSSDRPH